MQSKDSRNTDGGPGKGGLRGPVKGSEESGLGCKRSVPGTA